MGAPRNMVNEAGRLTSRLPEPPQSKMQGPETTIDKTTLSGSGREIKMLTWKSGSHAEKGQGGPERLGARTKRKPFLPSRGGDEGSNQLRPSQYQACSKVSSKDRERVCRGLRAIPAFRRLATSLRPA